jgi:hypothetical protein
VDLDAYQDLNGDRRVKPLQTQLADQQQGAAVHRVQIRGAPRGGPEMNEKAIHSADVKPSRSRHFLILDGQPAARFVSLPKAVAAIPPGLLFFCGVWRP